MLKGTTDKGEMRSRKLDKKQCESERDSFWGNYKAGFYIRLNGTKRHLYAIS